MDPAACSLCSGARFYRNDEIIYINANNEARRGFVLSRGEVNSSHQTFRLSATEGGDKAVEVWGCRIGVDRLVCMAFNRDRGVCDLPTNHEGDHHYR